MNKNLAVSLIVLLAVLAGGYWVWQDENQSDNTTTALSAEDQVFLDSIPYAGELPVPNIDTSSWRTYRNEEYGFEIKYPDRTEPREVCDAEKCGIASEWFVKDFSNKYQSSVGFSDDASDSRINLIVKNLDDLDSLEEFVEIKDVGWQQLQLIIYTTTEHGWIIESVNKSGPKETRGYALLASPDIVLGISGLSDDRDLLCLMLASLRLIE